MIARRGWLAPSSLPLIWLGVVLFGVNVAFILATGDDGPVWPTHYSSILLVALGTTLLGVGLNRAGAVRSGAAALTVLATGVLPFSQMQDARVLLWLPLGLAWLALGWGVALPRRDEGPSNA